MRSRHHWWQRAESKWLCTQPGAASDQPYTSSKLELCQSCSSSLSCCILWLLYRVYVSQGFTMSKDATALTIRCVQYHLAGIQRAAEQAAIAVDCLVAIFPALCAAIRQLCMCVC
jgi:hypothetical protein